MKIGEFARAARTTSRTVRHYHQLGLLPEPVRRSNGYREYALHDLVRLLRIAWLTKAGVPLARVGDLLAADSTGTEVGGDLDLIAQTIAAERDRLDRQLAALKNMRSAVDRGRGLTALPEQLAGALDAVASEAQEDERNIIDTDRLMLEIMALTGDLTDEMAGSYQSLAADPVALREALDIAAKFAQIAGRPVADCSAEIDHLVELFIDNPTVMQMMSGGDPQPMPTTEATEFFLPDAAQREVVHRLLTRVADRT